jgi:hypothetical protein
MKARGHWLSMSFNPREEYIINPKGIRFADFYTYAERYVTRPPYQRKTVWRRKKKQALMDSLLRRYYVPRLVLRQVRLNDTKTVDEVIDGQQRITALQDFFEGRFPLPPSLKDLSSALAGKYYKELDVDVREYLDNLELQADRILNIDAKDNPHHQRVATEIFWRLQQGETLNAMEVAHARLASPIRNFLVKHADDITFDYEQYKPVDTNPNKHAFFKILHRGNERMQHSALLARMVLIEREGGYTELKDTEIQELIDNSQTEDGIGDDSFEKTREAQSALKNLKIYYDLFKNDPMIANGGTIRELNREYFIISFYMLIRYIGQYYVIDDDSKRHLREFFDAFYQRWKTNDVADSDILRFGESRQQDPRSLRERDIVLRYNFFQFLKDRGIELRVKDSQRSFNEAERIAIYRKHKGLCRTCLDEGYSEQEAEVPWSDFHADHIMPWSAGGPTTIENGQLLCRYHNQSKGASMQVQATGSDARR